MFFLLLKKNYSISILHGSESLPVVVITIHPPKGRQATPKGQPKDGEVYFPSLQGARGLRPAKVAPLPMPPSRGVAPTPYKGLIP